MKILAAADMHYGSDTRARMRVIAAAMCRADADAIVLAGDFIVGNADDLDEALALFDEFTGPKVMVPGNHDLWETPPDLTTRDRYERVLPATAARHDFHLLDRGPLMVGDTAFVGNIGWYDYGFRQADSPRDGLTVTPVDVSGGPDRNPRFASVPGRGEMSWPELTGEDYEHKALVWQAGDSPHVAVCNDGLYVDWGRSDGEMTRHFADLLRAHLAEVAGEARRVVAVTHFVPFAEFVGGHTDDVKHAFARAYLGSPLLGEAMRGAENLAVVIFGHRHRQQVMQIGDIVAADASVARPEERPLILELPD